MKKQRTCIFCGRKGGISKEHFWPDWLGLYLPKRDGDRHISEIHAAEGKAPKQLQNRTERQGSVITKKIRVVCRECNNGWMSALEEKVKPILIGLLKEHVGKLDKEQISDLSLWVTVKTIVGEHAEGDIVLTPSTDRHQVYKEGVIPDYFRIFAGIHSSDTNAGYVRHSTTISRTMDGPKPPLSPEVQRNIQSVSFLVGPLVLHVIAARVADFSIDETFSFRDLVRLWPPSLEQIDLFSLRPLDDTGLSTIASQLDRLISLPNV